MKRKYKETEEQAAARFMAAWRSAAALFPVLRRVILAYDGKMYNKRFADALQSENKSIYARYDKNNRRSAVDIYYYTPGGETLSLCWYILPEDKRINAADFIQAAANKRAEYLQNADHMAAILPTIETRRKQIEIISAQLNAITCDLSYGEQELFDLTYSIRKRW